MTWQEAILDVLREAGEPMAYKDIAVSYTHLTLPTKA